MRMDAVSQGRGAPTEEGSLYARQHSRRLDSQSARGSFGSFQNKRVRATTGQGLFRGDERARVAHIRQLKFLARIPRLVSLAMVTGLRQKREHAAVLGRVQGLRSAPTPLRVAPRRPGPGLRATPLDSVYRRRPTCVLDGSIATSTAHNSRRPLRRVALVQLAVCVTRSSRWRLRHAQRTGSVRARIAACIVASNTSARRPMGWCDRTCVPRSGSHLASS